MNIRSVRNTFILTGVFYLLISSHVLSQESNAEKISAERQTELLYLLKHDCGSCHGMTRKGGLGSPLLSSALSDRSDDTLISIILDGIPGVPMPPWRPFINPDEAKWLVQVLRQRKDNE